MYRQLGEGRLHSGEVLEIGVVEAPDPAWADPIGRFLVHKGGDWNYHINRALNGPLDDLQTAFYVGLVEGELVSQVMVSGARKAGILGHVFTAPLWRQRGAYRQVMAVQMADMPRRGVEILTLGTGYDSHPYHIYASFGFRPVAPEHGFMRWLADPAAEQRYLAAAPATVRPLCWGDWGALNVLMAQPVGADDPRPRLPTLGIKGQHSAEGAFLTFMRRSEHQGEGGNRVVQSDTGAVTGWCLLAPDPRWFGDVWLLDVGVQPAFARFQAELTRDLPWPAAPIYAMQSSDRETAWLRHLGFAPLATLPLWLNDNDGRRDLGLWWRDGK
jgi:hypothetical protein